MRRIFGVITRLTTLMAIVAITSVACAPRVVGLRHDPAFNPAALGSGGIYVAAVTSSVRKMPPEDVSKITALLYSHLADNRSDLAVKPAGALATALGPEKYDETVELFAKFGMLEPKRVTEIGTAANKSAAETGNPTLQYAVFARVDGDTIENDRLEKTQHDEKGNIIPGTAKVITTVTRTMTVAFTVYDLNTGADVWTGSIAKLETAEREYPNRHVLMQFGSISIVADRPSEEEYQYPPAPDEAKPLTHVFRAFASALPK